MKRQHSSLSTVVGYPAQAELGIAYRFGQHQGFGLHLGFTGELLGNIGLRYKTHLDDLSLNVGVGGGKTLYLLREITAVHGRPLRTEEGFSQPAIIRTGSPCDSCDGFSHLDQQALGDLWLHKAQAEWLSVPAFQQLIQDLTEVKAPQDLILQARRAKRDEIQHTLLTAGISSMVTGQSISIEAPTQTS